MYKFPKTGKNRPQGFSRGAFPYRQTQEQTCGVAHADIPGAQSEIQIQPNIKDSSHKHSIAEEGKPLPEGAEKPVAQPQHCSQKASAGKEPGGCAGVGHRNSRCQRLRSCRLCW